MGKLRMIKMEMKIREKKRMKKEMKKECKKEVMKKNVNSEVAVGELINLLKENNVWIEQEIDSFQ
mgnify:CR=1 FL=1